jgi:hypothetical protein
LIKNNNNVKYKSKKIPIIFFVKRTKEIVGTKTLATCTTLVQMYRIEDDLPDYETLDQDPRDDGSLI